MNGRALAAVVLFGLAASRDADDLLEACFSGDQGSVEAEMARGVDVDSRGKRDVTCMILAAYQGHAEVVRRLARSGADVEAQAADGTFAIVLAAGNGHLETVRALIDAGAKVYRTDHAGKPAVVRAADNGHAGVVDLLVDAGSGRVPSAREHPPFPEEGEFNLEGVQAPKALFHPSPIYPSVAAWAGHEGTVVLRGAVTEKGTVHPDLRVVESIPGLDQAAIDAVRRWRFEPALRKGQPVLFPFTTTVTFSSP